MTSNELVTKEDLEVFGNKLLEAITIILQPGKGPSKQWLKSKDVRKLLNISPGTLQNLRINGTLSYTKIGGMIYYKLEDIHKVLEGGKH
ncbi:helix-turn-helix domain-containing protein [Mucilaginibacter sp. SMC90]|uniref:helix-turn-helix domain-containing protein n=1 Tax=Mucilaginibacter sp. SMC90 TaxID=2929803 RepID=UPI001FB1EEF5|nr:helix-turn-helix domain-containing protein [Mucilaginibacter sp. SMC90]UOE49163.1 helix-turn-helix domain-containing protein [Mucilaginibacter sp. SMC90]